MTRKNVSSRRKIIVSFAVLSVFFVGVLASIILVLASSRQSLLSNINVSYVSNNVAAQVTGKYWYHGSSKETMGSITFNANESSIERAMQPSGNIVLSEQEDKVYFEYAFKNLSQSRAFTIELTHSPKLDAYGVETNSYFNMTETYYVSAVEIDIDNLSTMDLMSSMPIQPVMKQRAGENDTVYVYVVASIYNSDDNAAYNGTFTWELNNVSRSNIRTVDLNNGSGSESPSLLEVVKIDGKTVNMPAIYEFPTFTGEGFAGYFDDSNFSIATQYVKYDGSPMHVMDLPVNSGAWLYARSSSFIISEDGWLYRAYLSSDTLNIPDSVSYIGKNLMYNNTELRVLNVPNTVTYIDECAFEGCTNLREVNFDVVSANSNMNYTQGTGLSTIGYEAFKGCTGLTSLTIPRNVTSIVFGAFEGCTNLSTVTNNSALIFTADSDDYGKVAKYATTVTNTLYDSDRILTIYQQTNILSPLWTKYGYNATLSANATKVESNDMAQLQTYLAGQNASGNADLQYGVDEYVDAVVYKDIDLVNVDLATGEIIGKLSDLSYDFEWFGRSVTLPAGTTLASGRTLSAQTTFAAVDVYTYYPTMYLRRWVVDGKQIISISDQTFTDAVKIDEYYTATFESTIFNPDKSVAHNSFGIYPRSYVYDDTPLTDGSVAFLQENFGYGTYEGSTAAINKTKMMEWTSNLTKAWEASGLSSDYKSAVGAQGENYTAFAYNLLYLVKYANNNAQATVGQGNVKTYGLYYGDHNFVNASGDYINAEESAQKAYLSERGAGAIGVHNGSETNTATYDSSNNYKLSATGFNVADMNYGYNYDTNDFAYHDNSYSVGYAGDKVGLYAHQFLSYNNGVKRTLLDGYVGSDGYTSVFCLGQCNAWGNTWSSIFGTAVVYDGGDYCVYINYYNYDYENPDDSWLLDPTKISHESLEGRDYVRLSYTLPHLDGTYRNLSTDASGSAGGLSSLIGIQGSDCSLVYEDSQRFNWTSGLCDDFMPIHIATYSDSILGIERGGYTMDDGAAGPFYFYMLELSQERYTQSLRVQLFCATD